MNVAASLPSTMLPATYVWCGAHTLDVCASSHLLLSAIAVAVAKKSKCSVHGYCSGSRRARGGKGGGVEIA